MMKRLYKLIFSLVLLFLCTGCDTNQTIDKYKYPGFSEEEILILKTLREDTINRFKSGDYPKEGLELVTKPSFFEDNLATYLKFYKDFGDYTIPLVNKGFLNDDTASLLLSLVNDPYYLLSRTERYLNTKIDDIRKRVEYVNADRDLIPYEQVEVTDLSKEEKVQINKHYHFDEKYEPSDLVDIDPKYGINTKLRQVAYDAYIKMYEAALKDGMNLRITSAYRSYIKQVNLYGSYEKSDGKEKADTYSARPGFSDHQTGLTVDILTPYTDFATFENSNEATWLAENAYKYGFIIRYPKDKEDVTGYVYEAWHYRYVGEIAKDVYDSGLTYDEYYTYYIRGN